MNSRGNRFSLRPLCAIYALGELIWTQARFWSK
jgi:hypothetical protein